MRSIDTKPRAKTNSAPRPCWCAAAPAIALWRDLRGALPDLGLRLRQRAEEAEARFAGDEPGYIYSRFANPTTADARGRGWRCWRAPRTAAPPRQRHGGGVHAALMCQLRAGDHVVAGRRAVRLLPLDPGTMLPRFGVETSCVDGTDLAAWARGGAAQHQGGLPGDARPTRLLEMVDIAAVAEIAHAAGAKVVVDNVFATPLCSSRWSSAPTWWSIRPPSTSTARAGCWAARSWRERALLNDELHAIPAPHRPGAVARSTPGCC